MRTKPNGGNGSVPESHPEFLYSPNGDRIVFSSAKSVAEAKKNSDRRRRTSSDVPAISFDCLDHVTPLDLIQQPHDPSRTLFAVKKPEGIKFTDRVEYHGQFVFAPRCADSYLMHTRLPRGVQPCGTSTEMATAIGEFVSDIIAVPHDVKLAIECFVLQSWVYKFLPICPTMILHGPPEFGEAIVDLLRLVCRRPLVVGYATTTSLLRAYSHFKPTLLIQESGLRQAVVRILRMGARPNTVPLQGGDASSPFGPRLITCSTLPGDSHLLRNAIVVRLPSNAWGDVAKLSTSEVLNRADLLQQRLLGFEL